MHEIAINWLAVVVAAVIRLALGSLWYSPIAFAPMWLKTVGMTPQQLGAGLPKAIIVDAIGSLLMSFILLHAVVYAGAADIWTGAAVGALNWLGFVATVLIATNVYEQRPLRSAYISGGFNFVALILMGALLAIWR